MNLFERHFLKWTMTLLTPRTSNFFQLFGYGYLGFGEVKVLQHFTRLVSTKLIYNSLLYYYNTFDSEGSFSNSS